MPSTLRTLRNLYWRYRKWQELTREPGLSVLLGLEVLLLFVVTPLAGSGWLPSFVSQLVFAMFVLATLVVTSHSHWASAIVFVAVVMSPIGSVLYAQHPSAITAWLSAGGGLLAVGALSVVIARAVFAPGNVTWHRVQGAIVLYMNFALFFFILYRLVWELTTDAFKGLPPVGTEHGSAAALIYFSFCTLTTTSYGDILPVDTLARHLANLEAVIGQLFPPTLLARLVSLHLEHRRNSKHDRD